MISSPGRRMVVVGALCFAVAGWAAGCSRKEAPEVQPAPPPPAPAPPPAVRDAAPDVVDAAVDAVDARRPAAGGKRGAAAPAGGGGLKIEGGLPRAESDKVIREGQSKLRACYAAAKSKGAGGKGRVSFKMTVDDRGHVTVAEIPTSTLPGGSDVETCMVHALRDLRFPRSSGESTISFQMSFGP